MKYKSKNKSALKRIQNIYNVGDGDEEMNSNLSRLSGQKGAEKKTKDKIGRARNRADPAEVFEKMQKRINKEREI